MINSKKHKLLLVLAVMISFFSCKKEDKIPPKSAPVILELDTLDSPKEYLIVKVSNIKEIRGELRIAVYNNKSDFDTKENPVVYSQVPVTQNTFEVKYENLPPSANYAITVHHDANMNGKIDTNIFGIPKEGFCFSNNAMGSFGPPSYEDCKFEIKKGTYVIQDLKLIFF